MELNVWENQNAAWLQFITLTICSAGFPCLKKLAEVCIKSSHCTAAQSPITFIFYKLQLCIGSDIRHNESPFKCVHNSYK